jgi:hypothetical protein
VALIVFLGGIFGGAFAGATVARLLGVHQKSVEVGRVGDQPIYEYQNTLIGTLLSMVGAFAGVVVAVGLLQSGILGK